MKILLALDGSRSSLVARDLVASLRWPPETSVDVVAAYQVPVDWTGGVGSAMDWVGEAEDAVRDDLAAKLVEMSEPLVDAGLHVKRHTVPGRAADAVIGIAAASAPDLIVTGSRGHGPLRTMLLGSVASEVTSRAECPVLVARGPAVTRLLVATDGSAAARLIPDRLSGLGAFAGLRADVVAVAARETPAYELMIGPYAVGDERLERQRADLRALVGEAAEDMASRLSGFGIPATPHVRSGDPSDEILAAADDHAADLIVTGSRGLGGIDRLLLGSVARNVLSHSHTSVLIIHGGSDTAKEA
jgi:nucleotide-binding universal stress UspA family protein